MLWPTLAAGLLAAASCSLDASGLSTTTANTGTGGTSTATAGATGAGATSGSGGSGGSGNRGAAGTAGEGRGGRGGSSPAAGTGGRTGTCSPSTCATGCCDQNRCVTEPSADFCGSRGGACEACGGCQVCTGNGTCAIDPSSRWTIVCESAQLPMTSSSGIWDTAGQLGNRNPDPFCEFEVIAGVVTDTGASATSTVMDSFAATWNETVTPPGVTISGATLLSSMARWRLWVGDDDGCNAAGCFGDLACEIRPPLQAAWLQSGGFTVMNVQDCAALSVSLICQQ
jgi:hypothetical protein